MIRSYKRLNDNMHNPKRRKGNDLSLLLALRYYLTFIYCAQAVLFLMLLIFTFFLYFERQAQCSNTCG